MHVDASVPKECSDPVFDQLWEKFLHGKCRKMRGIPVYKAEADDGSTFYVAAEPRGRGGVTIHGWLNVSQPRGWKCWQVDQVFVYPQSRGLGWGRQLYDAAIERDGLILASGFEQSRLGRRMWKTMVRSGRYTIWAHDFMNRARFADVVYDRETDRITSPLKLYERWACHQDIRLVAIRKGKK